MGNRGEQCGNIIGHETLSWEEGNLPNLIYKVTGTLYIMWQLTYKGFKYFSNDLCNPISGRAPARYNWPKVVPVLWILGKP